MRDQILCLNFLLLLSFGTDTNAKDFIETDKLYFRNQNLTAVPSGLVADKNAKSITKAIFSHNNLDVLKTSDFIHFSQFPNVKYVFFDHNNVSSIENNTFKQVPKMKFLELSHNRLNEISDDLYNDLTSLKFLQYINLKRNPIKNFKNIDKLTALGVQVEYDGVLGREKRLRMRNRRVAFDGLSIDNDSNTIDKDTEEKEELELVPEKIDKNEDEEEERNFTTVHDKPVKAFVVDHKMDPTNRENFKINNNFLGSIVFNFLAAFLVLVALPIAMVVYYFMHRKDVIS